MLSQPPTLSEKRVYIEFGKKLAVYSRWGLIFYAACREPEVRMGNWNSGLGATGIPDGRQRAKVQNMPIFPFFNSL